MKAVRLRRYRISWFGSYDGPRRYPRILTMRAQNKQQAEKLHSASYPAKERFVEFVKS